MFGKHGNRRGDREARLREQLERLRALGAAQLAGEVLDRCAVFAPEYDRVTTGGIAEQFVPQAGLLRGPGVTALSDLVDEGAQTLIRAGLFVHGGWGGAGHGNVYLLSSAGRRALAEGTAATALASAPS